MSNTNSAVHESQISISIDGEFEDKSGWTVNYDIDNIKYHPTVLQEGEQVVITEKLLGVCCQIGYIPELNEFIVTSKDAAAKGLALKTTSENNNNLYLKIALGGEYSILDKIKDMALKLNHPLLSLIHI